MLSSVLNRRQSLANFRHLLFLITHYPSRITGFCSGTLSQRAKEEIGKGKMKTEQVNLVKNILQNRVEFRVAGP
jgi:hypothetical protein